MSAEWAEPDCENPPEASEGAPLSVRARVSAQPGQITSGANGGTRTKRPVSLGDRFRGTVIPSAWWAMTPVLALALSITSLLTWSLPPLGAIPLIAMALMAPLLARKLGWLGRAKHQNPQDYNAFHAYAILSLTVALPMTCFGLALGLWADGHNAHIITDAGGAAIIAGVAAAIISARRQMVLVASQIGLWIGLCLMAGSFDSVIMLLQGCVISAALSFREKQRAQNEQIVMEENLRIQQRAEMILADYEESGQGWFWETDRRGNIAYISSSVGAALGREIKALIGRPFSELFILDDQGADGERPLTFHLTSHSAFNELGVRAAVQDEKRYWSITGRPLYDNYNNFIGFRGSGHDLTEKRRTEESAQKLAQFDSLTGLANRFHMSQRLEKILNAPNHDHRACAVFLLDLDRFKQVNDTMGHPAGDALLKQVAKRLERSVHSKGWVGRLGGDEFQLVIPGRHRNTDLAELAENIIASLTQPYSIEGHRIMIGASLGIALSPNDGVTSEALIRNADLALYAAKDGGRGRHHFYAADLHTDAEERRELEQELRDAISQGGLELHYQPVVHTTTEKITGFEALLRWNHPVRGAISPVKFIPIAEDTGLIAQLGEWALRTACHDLALWPENIRVAVNVSPLQFSNPALPAIITSALASAQIEPSRLELEITESVFLNDDAGTDAMFSALKAIGVRLSLDDFGTGYSSLGYLKKAPFDKIKIDQSFVRGATMPGSRNGALIASIVGLAEALGMETTAEGVETHDELDLVRSLGVSHIQGYIYEKPLSLENATARLMAGMDAIAHGPRSARATRQTMLRIITLDHGGEQYQATIRNISTSGAMIEGLWNVPPGTIFTISIGDGQRVTATARWCQEDRMGVEFSAPLQREDAGLMGVAPRQPIRSLVEPIRKAG